MSEIVNAITLVDFDVYKAHNLSSQMIMPEDIGEKKVFVTAARLRRINPSLTVSAFPQPLEALPRGALRADVFISCLDSKRSRTFANEIASRLAVPYWLDTGVEPEQRLARLSVFAPGRDAPCYECAFGEDAYASIEQVVPCGDELSGVAAPTGAPGWLGALAAALASSQLELLWAGRSAEALVNRELVVDATNHSRYVTTLRRNPDCRFLHGPWQVEKLAAAPAQLSLGSLSGLSAACGVDGAAVLRVEGQRFLTRIRCVACAKTVSLLLLSRRFTDSRCPACGDSMAPLAFFTRDRLDLGVLPERTLQRSLASIGFLAGDLFALQQGAVERYFELGGS